MIPRKLRVHGLTCFRQPVELDLDTIPPNSIVAVVGPIGAGKTSLMEAMGPGMLYRRLPSRDNALMLKYCVEKASVVDSTFNFDGATYRALHMLNPTADGGRGKGEAYLYRDGEPLNDGKVVTFDPLIASLFPPRSVFLASAFAAQDGTGNWLREKPAARRDLFTTMLGNGDLQALTVRSRDQRKVMDASAGELERKEAALREDTEDATRLDAELVTARATLSEATAALETATTAEATHQSTVSGLRAKADDLQKRRDDAHAEKQRLAAAVARLDTTLDDIAADIASARKVLDQQEQITADSTRFDELTATRERLIADWRVAKVNADGATAAHTSAVAALEAAGGEQGRLTAMLATAEEEVTELATLEEQAASVGDVEGDLIAANAGLESRDAARQLSIATLASMEGAEGRVRLAERTLESLQEQASLVDEVPCEGEVLRTFEHDDLDGRDCGACKLLAVATDARSKIGQANTDLQAAIAEDAAHQEAKQNSDRALQAYWTAVGVADKAKALCTTHRGTLRDIDRLRKQVAKHDALREGLEPLATRVQECSDAVAAANKANEDALAEMSKIDKQGATARADLETLAGAPARLLSLRSAEARLPDLEARHAADTTRRGETAEALAAVEIPGADYELAQELETASSLLRMATLGKKGAQQDTDDAREAAARIEGQRTALRDLTARAATLAAQQQRVSLRRKGWVLLERALGREGIQALEIDAAGPEVSGLVNDLLEACYGSRFRVDLRTIREAGAGKKQKEVFDLMVHDGQQGGTRLHGDLSGGQKVLISEALQLALALFHGRRSGAALQTLWRDEADGSLDHETALRYPSMLRAAMEIGGFSKVFYISHRPDVAAQADAQIIVENGTARIEL